MWEHIGEANRMASRKAKINKKDLQSFLVDLLEYGIDGLIHEIIF
jgi:hypothetical protein